MAIFRERMLARSEIFALFIVCTIPIHIWSLLTAFRVVGTWVIKMSMWDVIGVFAYTQAFALFETIIAVLLLALLFFLLPRFVVRESIVPMSMMIVFSLTIWLVVLHLFEYWIDDQNATALASWGISLIVALCVSIFLAGRSGKLQVLLPKVLDRIMILAIFFLFVGLLSVLIVAVRNIVGAFS